jgi:hypothetical protein
MTHERLERRLDEREERRFRDSHGNPLDGERRRREVRARRAGFASWADEERHIRGEVPAAYWTAR